jgi:hypothetical protein
MRRRGISYMKAIELVRDDPGRDRNGAGPRDPETWWLKSLHYRDDGWTILPGERTWISDIGRIGKDGSRVYRKDGTPWGEPSWKISDQVGLYLSGTLRVPILVEVLAPARFDPDFVQANSYGQEPDAGERWPWVTEVRGVRAVSVRRAPTLDDLGVRHESMMQRPRLLLTPNQMHQLDRALR